MNRLFCGTSAGGDILNFEARHAPEGMNSIPTFLQVASRRLDLHTSASILSGWAHQGQACAPWVPEALDPDKPVVFLDTALIAPMEESGG